MNLAHSNGKPGVLPSTINIDVRFASTSPIELQITGSIMKAKRSSHPVHPSPFQGEEPNPLAGLVKIEFQLAAPTASSVKLAADFTDWEKSPLDLIKAEDGTWFTIVPLWPGHYFYRFIVDGQWADDPTPVQRVPNPFGTTNAVVDAT